MNDNPIDTGPGQSRSIVTFDITDEIMRKLIREGFTTIRDVNSVDMSQIQKLCSFTDEECDMIIKNVKNAHKSNIQMINAKHLMIHKNMTIKTFCESLNNALNGGINTSQLTEISGEAGAGKSQICMHLCVNIQLPQSIGGLSSEAVYIDTERKFRTDRITSMAKYAIKCCKKMINDSSIDYLTVDYIKSHIHVYDCNRNSDKLINIINHELERLINENPNIKLVIIDSIAQHFRYDYRDSYQMRGFELTIARNVLRRLAFEKKIAVLLINQVTFDPNCEAIVPALGKLWQHVCCTNIMIQRNGDNRIGIIRKSPVYPEDLTFKFVITEEGIRDVITRKRRNSIRNE